MLTSKQRAILRAQANGLDVVFQVGKGEIDDALVKSTADCLAARELIKMKVLENSAYSAKEAAAILAERTRERAATAYRPSAPNLCCTSRSKRKANMPIC